jgi:hypothetical protein
MSCIIFKVKILHVANIYAVDIEAADVSFNIKWSKLSVHTNIKCSDSEETCIN